MSLNAFCDVFMTNIFLSIMFISMDGLDQFNLCWLLLSFLGGMGPAPQTPLCTYVLCNGLACMSILLWFLDLCCLLLSFSSLLFVLEVPRSKRLLVSLPLMLPHVRRAGKHKCCFDASEKSIWGHLGRHLHLTR